MTDSSRASKLRIIFGCGLIAIGIIVFVIRFSHEGAYAMPRGGALFGGVGPIILGTLLAWSSAPRPLSWVALAVSPVILYFGLYATMSELEEVVSLYATDSKGQAAELRLWIIDREDGEWVGMQESKAIEHALDGACIGLLRNGVTRNVMPVLHKDRPTVTTVHALKVEKYAVARFSASLGLYPSEASATTVSLRLDPCP